MNWPAIREKLDLYEKLMRLDKPIGILLLLWPTLWALWIASDGEPGWVLTWIFVLGTVLMRSAGCVLNDIADREFDRHVERTRDRPLTAGMVSVREALLVAAALIVCAGLLILPLSPLVWELAVVALLLAASYPFTKRFFAIPQAYLGVAFGFGIPMAFAAVQGHVPAVAWVMLAANIAWAVAYDTEYAMVDREDDIRIGIKTSAITFGDHDVAVIMLCYCIALGLLLVVGEHMELGTGFRVGLVLAATLAVYHWTLINKRERAGCFQAFLHNNWLGAAIFAGLVVDLNLKPFLR